jgi:hypothetical protein
MSVWKWGSRICVSVLAVGLTLLAGSELAAQRISARDLVCGARAGVSLYDPATVQTVVGEIVGIEQVSCGRGRATGVHVSLRTATETVMVHLGPSWFLEGKVQLREGDRLEVRGSRVMLDGAPAVIAAELRRGDATLQLRDARGLPAWRGERRGG